MVDRESLEQPWAKRYEHTEDRSDSVMACARVGLKLRVDRL